MRSSKKREWVSEQILECYDKLYRLAYTYTKSKEDAMDIVQESAYKALNSVSKLKSEEYIKTWIYRIVINTATDYVRKRKKEMVGIEEYVLNEKGKEAEEYKEIEIMDLLGYLEEKDRTVVILRYFEDMKLDEIAQITDEKLSTVKTRLYRSLKQLRIELEDKQAIS